jgi:hypothetical protein
VNIDPSDLAEFRRVIQAEKNSITSNIQPNVLTGAGLAGAYIGPQVFTQYEFTTTPQTMLYHASIERAENGYILKIQHKQNETAKIYIAATTEELQRVFIAAIVAERVSR